MNKLGLWLLLPSVWMLVGYVLKSMVRKEDYNSTENMLVSAIVSLTIYGVLVLFEVL